MNILVFGGTGFIGSNLVPRLLSEGNNLTIIDQQKPHKVNRQLIHKNIKYIKCDITNIVSLERTINKLGNIDVLIYLISTTKPTYSNENPVYDINSNLNSIVNLLQLQKIRLIKKIIYLSSGGTVYGDQLTDKISELHQTNPIVSYGIIKLAIEKYLLIHQKRNKNKLIILRVSNPYGPGQIPGEGQGLIATIISKNLNKSKIEIFGDGKLVRDYIYIDDLIEAILKCLKYEGSEKIFNIGSGSGKNINEIINIVCTILGSNMDNINYVDSRVYDLDKNILDISLAKNELDWAPTKELNYGIKKTVDWMINNYEYINNKYKYYKISIIIPCYNEEKHICNVINEIISYRTKYGLNIEIIIVNDGSTDRTKECILEEMKNYSDIYYIEHTKNRGIGASFKTGLKFSSGEYVLLIPGDGENSIAHILYAYPLLTEVDIVIPFILDQKLRTFSRRFISSFYTLIINIIFFINLNYFNGTVIYRSNIIKKINFNSTGFFYQTEILIKIIKLGYLYAEVPICLNRKSNGLPKVLKINELIKLSFDFLKLIVSFHILRKI